MTPSERASFFIGAGIGCILGGNTWGWLFIVIGVVLSIKVEWFDGP